MPYGQNLRRLAEDPRPKRKPPAYTPPASLTQKIAAIFAQLPTPQCGAFLGLHEKRISSERILLELRHALTGDRFYLGTFPASDYQTVLSTALAAIERERKQLAAQFRSNTKDRAFRASA